MKSVSSEAGEESTGNEKDKHDVHDDITSQLKDDTHQTEQLINKAHSDAQKEMNKPKVAAKPQ
jgi:hypothetical protein